MSAPTAFDPAVRLGRGLVLANPITVASGTFGYGFEARAMGLVAHLGAIFTKGTTLRPRAGNASPRIAETTAGMLNSIGLQNPGVEQVVGRYAPNWVGWGVPVVVNVAGADIAEYVDVVERLQGTEGVAGVELNNSCPNIAHGLDFGLDPVAAARCVQAVRAVCELPLMVKLSPNVSDIAAMARAVADAGADVITAVNTYIGMKIALADRAPALPGTGTGGLSGPAIKPLALAAVSRIREAVQLPLMAIGGVTTAADALEFMVAGADAVQVGTANFTNPAVSREILQDCLAYAAEHRLARWADLRWARPRD